MVKNAAVELLDDDKRKLVGLSISRSATTAEVDHFIAALKPKLSKITIACGFYSAGERRLMETLLISPEARAIKVYFYALSHDYSPNVAWMSAIHERRLAIIARGNSPEELSRSACLDMNAKLRELCDHFGYLR